jgi:hypothetical protein
VSPDQNGYYLRSMLEKGNYLLNEVLTSKEPTAQGTSSLPLSPRCSLARLTPPCRGLRSAAAAAEALEPVAARLPVAQVRPQHLRTHIGRQELPRQPLVHSSLHAIRRRSSTPRPRLPLHSLLLRIVILRRLIRRSL